MAFPAPAGSHFDYFRNGPLQVLHVRLNARGRWFFICWTDFSDFSEYWCYLTRRMWYYITYDFIGFSHSEEAQQSLAIAEQLGDKFLTAKAQNLTGLAMSSQRTFCFYLTRFALPKWRDVRCDHSHMWLLKIWKFPLSLFIYIYAIYSRTLRYI